MSGFRVKKVSESNGITMRHHTNKSDSFYTIRGKSGITKKEDTMCDALISFAESVKRSRV